MQLREERVVILLPFKVEKMSEANGDQEMRQSALSGEGEKSM